MRGGPYMRRLRRPSRDWLALLIVGVTLASRVLSIATQARRDPLREPFRVHRTRGGEAPNEV